MALTLDKATVEAALIGYQHQLQHIESKMAELRRALRQAPEAAPAAKSATKTKTARKARHKMSEEGRARIAAAQRARWAKLKKSKA